MEIVLLIVGALIGGAISWFITHRYSEKSTEDNKKVIDELSKDIKATNTLQYFETLLETGKWKSESINHNEVWVSQDNTTFQIHKGEEGTLFQEAWTEVYINQSTQKYSVYLKIDNSIIKELHFISLDGGRIFVPMPDQLFVKKKPQYLWNLNSLELKVCKIVGDYYIHKNIEGVAKNSGIMLTN